MAQLNAAGEKTLHFRCSWGHRFEFPPSVVAIVMKQRPLKQMEHILSRVETVFAPLHHDLKRSCCP